MAWFKGTFRKVPQKFHGKNFEGFSVGPEKPDPLKLAVLGVHVWGMRPQSASPLTEPFLAQAPAVLRSLALAPVTMASQVLGEWVGRMPGVWAIKCHIAAYMCLINMLNPFHQNVK